jgi:hypothetical protein
LVVGGDPGVDDADRSPVHADGLLRDVRPASVRCELRELHRALDLAVRDAYGWSDLDLDHGFWDTPQGRRFTLGPAARTEVLDRLLELNHRRYAEEIAAGLNDKKKPSAKRRRAGQAETLL